VSDNQQPREHEGVAATRAVAATATAYVTWMLKVS
jgi:hypothetical protein